MYCEIPGLGLLSICSYMQYRRGKLDTYERERERGLVLLLDRYSRINVVQSKEHVWRYKNVEYQRRIDER